MSDTAQTPPESDVIYGTAPVPEYFAGTAAEWAVLHRALEAERRASGTRPSEPGRCGDTLESHVCEDPLVHHYDTAAG